MPTTGVGRAVDGDERTQLCPTSPASVTTLSVDLDRGFVECETIRTRAADRLSVGFLHSVADGPPRPFDSAGLESETVFESDTPASADSDFVYRSNTRTSKLEV